MSLETSDTINETGKRRDRNWRLEIDTPFGGDYFIRSHREELFVADSDSRTISREELPSLMRRFSEVSEETITFATTRHGTVTATIAELATAIIAKLDEWQTADKAV